MSKPETKFADAAWAAAFLSPGVMIIGLCVVLPSILAFALSFTYTSRFGSVRWAGLYNYSKLLSDPVALLLIIFIATLMLNRAGRFGS